MSQANATAVLRKQARRTVVLPAATAAARADGDLNADQEVTITIRKVRNADVMAITGQPQRLFALARDRHEGETKEQQRERLQQALTDDADILLESLQQQAKTQEAIVLLGVVEPELTRDGAGNTLTPNDLGADFELVYDTIVEFAGLPYGRLGGAANPDAFLADGVARNPEPDGEGVQHDASSPAE